MKRTDAFERFKIDKVSTNKVVLNIYLDSFGIEKVRFAFSEYQDAKNPIDIYVDFKTLKRLAMDAESGRLIKQIREGKFQPIMGGSKEKLESRIMSFGMTTDRNGNEKIFVNASIGDGKIGPTGLIIPNGVPKKKIGVGMTVDEFRTTLTFAYDHVQAYLSSMVPALVKENEEERKRYFENK